MKKGIVMSKKKMIIAALIVGIAAIIAVIAMNRGDDKTGPAGSAEAQLVDLENNEVDFSAFRGNVVFVNNWASWCPPCIAEMPSIQELKKKLADEDVVFVMVSFDQDPEKAKSFIRKRNFDFDIYFPGEKYPYPTSSIPATFILDKSGKVVSQHIGMADYSGDEIVNELKKLANE